MSVLKTLRCVRCRHGRPFCQAGAMGIIAMVTRNERFHATFAVAMFNYQVSWALRMFETLA